MPAQYVKPYVKTNKNDHIDAEACSEAVTRPTMRFVPIKSDDHPCSRCTTWPGHFLAREKHIGRHQYHK